MLYRPKSRLEWFYAIVVVAEAIISIALELRVFATSQFLLAQDATSPDHEYLGRAVSTLLSVLLAGWLYLLILLYDTLATQNIYQTIGLFVYSVVIVTLLSVQLQSLSDITQSSNDGQTAAGNADTGSQVWSSIGPPLLANIIITSVLIACQAALTFPLRKVFGGVIFKQFNADVSLRQHFRWVEGCLALFKVDLFLLPASVIAFWVIGGSQDAIERDVTGITISVAVITLCVAPYMVRHENYIGTSVVLILAFCYLAGLIFKMVRMYQPSKETSYLVLRRYLTCLSTISLLACVVTIFTLFKCMAAYRKGLKPYLTVTKRAYEVEMQHESHLRMRGGLSFGRLTKNKYRSLTAESTEIPMKGFRDRI